MKKMMVAFLLLSSAFGYASDSLEGKNKDGSPATLTIVDRGANQVHIDLGPDEDEQFRVYSPFDYVISYFGILVPVAKEE